MRCIVNHANSQDYSDPHRVTALVLVAHGKRSDVVIRDCLDVHVERISALGVVDHVLAAYLAHPPYLSDLREPLRTAKVTDAVVVPLFTGHGYYVDVAIPQALGFTGTTGRVGNATVYRPAPVGASPTVTRLLAASARRAMIAAGFEARQTAVVVCGHGTARHPDSGLTTQRHADDMAALLNVATVLATFLDQTPLIDHVYELTGAENLVVVPDLVGGGRHQTADLPHRLGFDRPVAMEVRSIRQRRVIIAEPVYADTEVTDVIVSLARRSGLRCLADASRSRP